jgi:hypothetical protein
VTALPGTRVSPTDPDVARRDTAGRVRRSLAAAAAVIALTVLLGACGGVLSSIISTRQSLDSAGYSHVSVGTTDDDVKVAVSLDQDASPAQVREVAAIVWREFHERFTAVEFTVHGTGGTVHETLGFSQLQQAFGARPAADNRTTLRDGILRTGVVILVIAAAVVIVVIVVVVLLVRRRRRPAGVGYGPGGPWGPGGPGGPWGQGGPGAPGGPYGPYGPGPGPVPGPGPGSGAPGGPPGSGDRAGPGGPWGPPAQPAPGWGPPRDPWEPPPGSGPPAW